MLGQAELDMHATALQETGFTLLRLPTVGEVRQVADALGISDADVRLRGEGDAFVWLEVA
jgi:hypothetical protein